MEKEKREQVFALCIEDKDSEDLEKRKIYTVIPDEKAERDGYFRVIPGGHPKSPTCGHLKIPHLPIDKLSKS